MFYYKVFKDFNNYVPIDETELEKALAAFKFGTAAIFNSGALEKIESVIPDLNRTMGWNPTYKLQDDDWSEIRSKGTDVKCQRLIEKTRDKIDYLLATNQKHLIGKGIEIELPQKPKEINDATKSLADKMRL